MSNVLRIQVDAMTGEVTTETLTATEIESINASNEIKMAERNAAEAARFASKASARAKLAAIGLTEDEITALVGG